MTLSMTCEQFDEILPQLLDDEAGPASMTPVVRAHIETCAKCRTLLEDLNGIREAAAALPTLTPSRDLWSGIASRIETPILPLVDGVAVRRPRRQISWRSAGIAAAVLVVANLAVSYQLMRRQAPATPAVITTADAPVTRVDAPRQPLVSSPMPAPSMTRSELHSGPMMAPMRAVSIPRPTFVLATNEPQDDQQEPTRRRETAKVVYDREINRLRAIVDSGRHKLDPATVALLDRNIRIIDLAIEQCNEALTRDSSSTFLIESLNNAYQTKVKLLRIAAAAASRG
jgi:hypothetical protein